MNSNNTKASSPLGVGSHNICEARLIPIDKNEKELEIHGKNKFSRRKEGAKVLPKF
jgi:hypothetical protein